MSVAQMCALVFLCVSVPDEVQESQNNDRSSHQADERAEGQKQIHSWNRKKINVKFNTAKNNMSNLPAILTQFSLPITQTILPLSYHSFGLQRHLRHNPVHYFQRLTTSFLRD